MPDFRHCLVALGVASFALPNRSVAQIRASERGAVSQTVDGTVISLDYARPRARGRQRLFGGVVAWKEVWTPGANWATTLEVSRNVQINGQPLPKGKYSVWLVVDSAGPWTLVLDPRHHRYHTEPPDSTADQLRVPVPPDSGPFTEVLTWSFPEIRADGATMVMQWGSVRVPFKVTVEPSRPITVPREEVASALGRYRFRWTVGDDTMKASAMTLVYDQGKLMGKWDPPPWPSIGYFLLIRIADHWFIPTEVHDGEIFDVMPEWVFEFPSAPGRVNDFLVRDEQDSVIARATRDR